LQRTYRNVVDAASSNRVRLGPVALTPKRQVYATHGTIAVSTGNNCANAAWSAKFPRPPNLRTDKLPSRLFSGAEPQCPRCRCGVLWSQVGVVRPASRCTLHHNHNRLRWQPITKGLPLVGHVSDVLRPSQHGHCSRMKSSALLSAGGRAHFLFRLLPQPVLGDAIRLLL
jgi:hypothetical protein